MVRFERQPPGTAITRATLATGGIAAGLAAWAVIAREPAAGAALAAGSGLLLLVGGHRANHGAGGPTDRMLDELLDRVWDGAVLGAIAWVARVDAPATSVAALVALSLSALSSYVRARGASLAYSVEESHVTRGFRYGLVAGGLAWGWLSWTLWVAAGVSAVAVLVRALQVAREERGTQARDERAVRGRAPERGSEDPV
jgi:hypothetical protein